MIERLERVVQCTILWHRPDGSDVRIRIGHSLHIDEHTFRVQLEPLFHRECLLHSIQYNTDIAAALSTHRATMDLYIALEAFAQDVRSYPEFTHEYHTRDYLPLAAQDCKARQALFRRLEAVTAHLPGTFVTMAARGTSILVDIDTPKRNSYRSRTRLLWYQRDQFGRSVRQMKPATRRTLGATFRQLERLERLLTNSSD